MTTVRAYAESDRESVVRLCLEDTGTLSAGDDMKKYAEITGCAYYLDCEPENCFVAADDEAGVIGCVLCAVDTDRYERVFSEKYVPQAASISARRYVDAKLSLLPVTMYRKFYPTHFRLYVDSKWTGLGVDELLLTALRGRLKDLGAMKVMTVCDAANEDARRFYEENGFGRMIETKYGCAMGMEIRE